MSDGGEYVAVGTISLSYKQATWFAVAHVLLELGRFGGRILCDERSRYFYVARIEGDPSIAVNVVHDVFGDACIVEVHQETGEDPLFSTRRFMVRGMNSEKPTVDEEKEE